MNRFGGGFALGQVDGHGNLDFTGGNHADVHAFRGEDIEHLARDTGV